MPVAFLGENIDDSESPLVIVRCPRQGPNTERSEDFNLLIDFRHCGESKEDLRLWALIRVRCDRVHGDNKVSRTLFRSWNGNGNGIVRSYIVA